MIVLELVSGGDLFDKIRSNQKSASLQKSGKYKHLKSL